MADISNVCFGNILGDSCESNISKVLYQSLFLQLDKVSMRCYDG